MACKRPFDDGVDESNYPNRDAKRQRQLHPESTIINEVLQSLVAQIEPFLRRVVREEVEHQLDTYIPRNMRCSEIKLEEPATTSANLRLEFRHKLCLPVFTCSSIKAEDGEKNLEIVLLDCSSRPVTSAQLSNLKVEIVALPGDFNKSDLTYWSEQDFDSAIVRRRNGRRPLLLSEHEVTLKNGHGTLREVSFTDNSSWTPSGKFRLGARVVSNGRVHERIREAITQPFHVKDHRGEAYMKRYPPLCNDEVWRLKNIMKDGIFHQRLRECGIETVEDFSRHLSVDPDDLKKMLKMSGRQWESTVQHARTCNIDGNVSYSIPRGEIVLKFDSVYRLTGVMIHGKLQSVNHLDKDMKDHVERIKKEIYENWRSLFKPETVIRPSISSVLPMSVDHPPQLQKSDVLDDLSMQPLDIQHGREVAGPSNSYANVVPLLDADQLQQINVLMNSFSTGSPSHELILNCAHGLDGFFQGTTLSFPENLDIDTQRFLSQTDALTPLSWTQNSIVSEGKELNVVLPSLDSPRSRKAGPLWMKVKAILVFMATKQSIKCWQEFKDCLEFTD